MFDIKDVGDLDLGKAGEHLVVADLILNGYSAFLADQGVCFDIVVINQHNRLIKIQVKTTRSWIKDKRGREVYRFQTRRGKGSKRKYNKEEIDIVAFVTLDVLQIHYIPALQNRTCVEFKRTPKETDKRNIKISNIGIINEI